MGVPDTMNLDVAKRTSNFGVGADLQPWFRGLGLKWSAQAVSFDSSSFVMMITS